MKISKETVSILKTLANVNTNILLTPGSKLATISPQKNIVAEITVAESFPEEFGIYDLNEFLGVLSLFSDAELEFTDKQVTLSEGRSSIKYFAADASILVKPTKALNFPAPEVTFTLPAATLAMAIKTASVLRSPDISFVGDGSEMSLVIVDLKNPAANSFNLSLGETDTTFRSNLKVENLKMMPGDYEVALTSKKISRFKNAANGAVFYVALELTSTMSA